MARRSAPSTLGKNVEELVAQAAEILGPGPVLDQLAACYREGQSLGQAFAQFISHTFAAQGLVVMDASSRGFHALGSDVLRQAIVRADELRVALNDRDQQLVAAGYHSQVLVPPLSSLLFLFDSNSGARVPLRRTADGGWHAARQTLFDRRAAGHSGCGAGAAQPQRSAAARFSGFHSAHRRLCGRPV